MKKKLLNATLALMLAGVGSIATAEKGLFNKQDPNALSCVQSRLTITEPKVVRVGKRGGLVRMKMTNGMPYPVRTIFLRYTVNSTTGAVLRADPVSLTIPAIAPGKTAVIETPFFGLPKGSPSRMVAGVKVFDVADPSGNQMVKNEDIIGLGWTGQKSSMGCN